MKLPSTSATTVSLEFQGKVEITSSVASTEKVYDESKNTTMANIFMGKDGDLMLTFRGEEKRSEMERFVVAMIDQHTVFDPAGSKTTARIEADSHRAPITSLGIILETDSRYRTCVRQHARLELDHFPDGKQFVEIRFHKPQQHVLVELALNRETSSEERMLPSVEVTRPGSRPGNSAPRIPAMWTWNSSPPQTQGRFQAAKRLLPPQVLLSYTKAGRQDMKSSLK